MYRSSPEGRTFEVPEFTLEKGEGVFVSADRGEDARLFLRALASLAPPLSGIFSYRGQYLEGAGYRGLLPYKRKVGYIGADSVLLCNRSLGENLVFARKYFEEDSGHQDILSLCRFFGIEEKLCHRPAAANPEDVRLALIVRELCKNPEILLVERPDHELDVWRYHKFLEILRTRREQQGTALVLYSMDQTAGTLCNRAVSIENGRLYGSSKEIPAGPRPGEGDVIAWN
ncbi:MAG: hypothetical protein JRI97_03325 [Deltaproteobacteria bacterium]|nr:hypothetical protein [Deltaproteobacteria bacterium]